MQNNINTKKYSPFNLAQFKMWLQDMKEKGETKFFEVYVNDFKVVPKTDNPDDFENHEQYVDDETTKLRVLVYNTKDSNRYKQHLFVLKEPAPQTNTLSGVEVDKKIEDEVNKGLKAVEDRIACEQVKKELKEAKEKLTEAKEYSDKLTGYIETLKEKLEKAQTVKEIVTAVAEFGPAIFGIKTNPDKTLSGNSQTEKKPEEEASFKMKSSESENSLSQQEKHFIEFGESLKKNFSKEEFEKILSVIDAFAKDKANINSVESFLNLNTNQQKNKNENGKV
ncbi:MAG: hypothetical protein HY841_00905 [Bacteroidetes bacterium]|nr:hypothetical protein [Bacteroidota bacterium]